MSQSSGGNDQSRIFYESEADAWFARNATALHNAEKLAQDPVLALIRQTPLRPATVLEVGASNGYRLGVLETEYNCRCVAVEPSEQAIEDGRISYPSVEFRRGLANKLPLKADETFDLVIVHFVLHWVARRDLLASIAELDRAVRDGGHLIIGDFLPDAPLKVPYHHLPAQDVYTFKQDYSAIFTASNLYTEIKRITFDHDRPGVAGPVTVKSRAAVTCLRKDLSGSYGQLA